MNLRRFCTLLGIAVFATAATATTAVAAIHRVSPGESIQAAIDAASPGDTILVEPGIYEETGNTEYVLQHIMPMVRSPARHLNQASIEVNTHT